jgi:hypothetical protein
MERELWPSLYRLLKITAKDFQQKYVHYQPWVVLAVMLWAALHDRPVSWACQEEHWKTTTWRPQQLPSQATLSRRVDKVAVGLLWRAVEQKLRDTGQAALAAVVDGKPLPIGGCSKDPDARYGRAAGGMAKGYKLHTVWSTRPVPETWEVTPMNTDEKTVAKRMIGQLEGGGYLLGDGNFDSNDLHDKAHQRGYQLVTPFRKAKNPGQGHRYQSPHRLRSIQLMQSRFGQALYQVRGDIERSFGNVTSFGGGLGPLPAWVRGQARVRSWVWAKLIINGVRILRRQRTCVKIE